MRLELFAIRDVVAGFFTSPFTAHSEQHAIRIMEIEANRPDSVMAQYPGSFDLYMLGDYDDQTAEIHLNKIPLHVINGTALTMKNNPIIQEEQS